jgi:putative spermidine/putrescine transport system permease protein
MSKSRNGADFKKLGVGTAFNKYLGVIPFFIFSGIFLVFPTISVVFGAFHNDKNEWSSKIFLGLLKDPISRNAFINSIQISSWTAISGAIIGGLFAWTLATSKEGSFFYKISVALSSVLAQFGGVMLTFAFLATFGFNGVISNLAVKHYPNSFLANSSWLYTLGGLAVVYTFFQIPLMVIVFLPTIQNMKPQWRESSDALGGNTWEYWLKVGIPILTPSFFGAALLLFVNSFSAYATAATLVNISSLLTTLQIATALQSEVGGANPTEAKALSLFMVAVVTLALFLYSLLRKRVSKWEKQ